MSKVTVVTATTGSKYLAQCIQSVQDQTFEDIQHLIFVDGIDCKQKVLDILNSFPSLKDNIDVIHLPYSVGSNMYNGHRMYGASFYFCKGDYVCFLDDDNWFDVDHVKSMISGITEKTPWAFSLRKIVDSNGKYICNDDCESLGNYPSILDKSDYFVDQNCYMIPKLLGLQLSPLFYRRFREPNQQELDRVIVSTLRNNNIFPFCNNKYSVNYRAGNTQNSVQTEFFINGNMNMLKHFNGKLPWNNGE